MEPMMTKLTAFAISFCLQSGVQCDHLLPLLHAAHDRDIAWCMIDPDRDDGAGGTCKDGIEITSLHPVHRETYAQECDFVGHSSTGWNVYFCHRIPETS